MNLDLISVLSSWFGLIGFFHSSEYFWAWYYHQDSVSFSSFCFSRDYMIAMLAGLIEFFIEYYLFPKMKTQTPVFIIGCIIMITGEAIRKIAMFSAKKNFTHEIAEFKTTSHKLVTNGIYSIVRHPGYTGWFMWAVGSQIMLSNPICTILFYYVCHNFFQDRVVYEEKRLIQFFGKDYFIYQNTVPSGIPFCSGYIVKDPSIFNRHNGVIKSSDLSDSDSDSSS